MYVIVGAMGINAVVLTLSMLLGKDMSAAQALALGFVNSLATGVTSFYFSRTNHTQIGGVGEKPTEEYKGR
jgi:enoyl-CoA hydratase/carnithine racemase